jgi:hypothetical protein
MMGNALMQPMMYFNLRNVPMFSGPYMIQKISHSISEGEFKTSVTGTRQPFYDLPKVDNFIQAINVNLIDKLKDQLQKKEAEDRKSTTNVITQINNVVSTALEKDVLTTNQDCGNNLKPVYQGYTTIDVPDLKTIQAKDLNELITNKVRSFGYAANTQSEIDIRQLLFNLIYLDSGDGNNFKAYENNLSSISLDETYGPSFVTYIDKKYFCVNRGNIKNTPMVKFTSLDKFMDFAVNKVNGILSSYTSDRSPDNVVKIYITSWPTNRDSSIYDKLTEENKKKLVDRFKIGNNLFVSQN